MASVSGPGWQDMKMVGTSLTAILSKSETLWCTRAATSEVHLGYALLRDLALCDRDYFSVLLPSNYRGCRKQELCCDFAHALQNRLLGSLIDGPERLFRLLVTQFWTEHSCRAFMPSATSQLVSTGEDRCARVAVRRVTNVQRVALRMTQKAVHWASPGPYWR